MAEGLHVDPHSLAELKRLGEAYKKGDKALQKRVRTALQKAGESLARQVIEKGSERMPARGGLRSRIAAARGGVTASLSGRNVSVSIRARTREGYALRLIDRGQVRHPVFGNQSVWVSQPVPTHAFTDAFTEGKGDATRAVNQAVQDALHDIAKDIPHGG